jgi:hypothetical protein
MSGPDPSQRPDPSAPAPVPPTTQPGPGQEVARSVPTGPPDDPRRLRCSDTDRERVAEALRVAAGDGRLTLSELEDRLEQAYSATTYGDLQHLTSDLPAGPYPVPGLARPPVPYSSGPASVPALRTERISAVLGDEKRSGRWEVPARIEVSVFLGSVKLDFTEAIVRHREVVVHGNVWLGDLTMIVPEGIDVRLEEGTSVLGERSSKLSGPVTRGGPLYRVAGTVVLGEIKVKPPRKPFFRRS